MKAAPNLSVSLRWFQFRLSHLQMGMLVLSLSTGWVMKERRRISERRERFKTVGLVCAEVSQPSWHVKIFGDDSPGYARVVKDLSAHVQILLVTYSAPIEISPHVTDAGLANLSGLTRLTEVHLNDREITDAGLVHLKKLTQLERIYLGNTGVTDIGIAHLQAALPNCKISRGSGNAAIPLSKGAMMPASRP